MTEKRFTVTLGKHMLLESIFIDLETEEKLTPNQVSKLLNDFHEENRRLKDDNKKLKLENGTLKSGNALLKQTLDKYLK